MLLREVCMRHEYQPRQDWIGPRVPQKEDRAIVFVCVQYAQFMRYTPYRSSFIHEIVHLLVLQSEGW